MRVPVFDERLGIGHEFRHHPVCLSLRNPSVQRIDGFGRTGHFLLVAVEHLVGHDRLDVDRAVPALDDIGSNMDVADIGN